MVFVGRASLTNSTGGKIGNERKIRTVMSETEYRRKVMLLLLRPRPHMTRNWPNEIANHTVKLILEKSNGHR